MPSSKRAWILAYVVGIVLNYAAVLCEYRAGIGHGSRLQRNLARLTAALEILRLWPVDRQTAEDSGGIRKSLSGASAGRTHAFSI
jgi:hypothetical protein